MAAPRTTMRKIREILRLRLAAGLSIRPISQSTKASVGAIQKLLSQAAKLDLGWPLPDDLDDAGLARLFYPHADARVSTEHHMPDWEAVHREIQRPDMTLRLLWEEYAARYPNSSYSYSQYCEHFRRWRGQLKRSMRQIHKAGEKCFIDYAGQTVPIVDPATGEFYRAQIFVAVLGASSYTFAGATRSQSLPDWLESHVRAFEFFGGVPQLLIPDNLRSAVSKACRYDPEINPSYQQLADHYRVAVIPARPYKPKDKAKAEVAVQIIERWILARLRHHTFFSLAELNHCIAALLVELNDKPFKQLPGNRRQAFEQLDRPALKALPTRPYRYVAIKPVKVNIDYHVEYDKHLYSVPHQYVGERLELHAGERLVEIYFRRQCVAVHPRAHRPGTTTEASHMPTRHAKHQQWTPQRLKSWARDLGAHAHGWVDKQLSTRAHPEQAYRTCLGLLNLSRTYPCTRLDGACRLASREGLNQLKHIKSILKSNRDQLPEQLDLCVQLPQDHENVRGPKSFT